MMISPYRVYHANYPFEARDQSELSIVPGHTLVVYQLPDGKWPDDTRWLNGREKIRVWEGGMGEREGGR